MVGICGVQGVSVTPVLLLKMLDPCTRMTRDIAVSHVFVFLDHCLLCRGGISIVWLVSRSNDNGDEMGNDVNNTSPYATIVRQ